MNAWFFLVGILCFMVTVGIIVGMRNVRVSGSKHAPVTVPIIGGLPPATPTPFPFADMTIPHLRSRTYESALGEKTKIGENGRYTSYTVPYRSDGLTIHGLFTIPKGDRPEGGWPAIVFVHGYIPPAQYRTTSNYVSYVDSLAREGFVVYKIDLRGHGTSEGEPGGAYYSSDYVIDTLNAVAALSSAGDINPAKIGLWGHSMAGNVVMRAFAASPKIPAVVIWAGAGYTYADLSTYRIADSSYRPPPQNTDRQRKRQALRDTYGEFSADHPFWRQVAVTEYLKDLKGALEIHHAVNDAVVSIEYSRNLMRLLDETQVPHRLYEYGTGGHNIAGESYSAAMNRSIEFFRSRL